MKVLVVDTNALIDLFDGDQEVAAVISSARLRRSGSPLLCWARFALA